MAKLSENLFLKKSKRPLIANIETEEKMAEFVGKHLFERNPYYMKAECHVITDGKTKKEVTMEIVNLL